MERYYKEVNELYLNTWALGIDELSPNQIQKLREIAPLCYQDAGTAIFKARTMLSSVDTTDYWNYCYPSLSTLPKEVQDTNVQITEGSFRVYPNPANEYLTIEYNLLEFENGQIVIKNAIGTLVRKFALPSGSKKTTLLFDSINNGVYSCIFKVNGVVVESTNVVILR